MEYMPQTCTIIDASFRAGSLCAGAEIYMYFYLHFLMKLKVTSFRISYYNCRLVYTEFILVWLCSIVSF